MRYDLQRLTLSLNRNRPFTGPLLQDGIFSETAAPLILSQEGFSGLLVSAADPLRKISAIMVGSPILSEGRKVDREKAVQSLLEADDPSTWIKSLNGEFLAILVDAEKQSLTIFTDRFSSYPLYWADRQGEFAASYLYADLASHCRNWPGFRLLPEKAFEFFVLQRMMNDGTHDSLTRCLPPATCLRIAANGISQTSYWQPDYTKDNRSSKKELTEKFTALVDDAVNMRLRGAEAGVFLSGGHDSRLVAMAARQPVTCYTLGFTDNFEVGCARRIARELGQEHVYLPLPTDYFEKVLDRAACLSGGMYATDHALFFPSSPLETQYKPVLLHGHGLDYMFQGMYLHARPRYLLGRPTYLRRPVPFPDDLAGHYIRTISYRLKYPMLERVVSLRAGEYLETLHASVATTVDRARAAGLHESSAIWEYLILHQISRHYTFTNVLSKRLCGEVRTPSLDNRLYDFYLALPERYRLHADMMRSAMSRLNPKVAGIPAGNHALPAGWGPLQKTAALIGRKLLRDLTGARRYYAPTDDDRTWPGRNDYLQTHPAYREAAMEVLQDGEFQEFLDFIDWARLRQRAGTMLSEEYGGAFWVSMLTYYRFYKRTYVRD